jgi:TPR repeat protein
VPVKVIAFRADPATVPPGGSFRLIWNVSGADRVSIDNGVGEVDLSASRTLPAASTTQYTLTAAGSNKQVSAYATLIASKAPEPPPSVSAAQNYADATAAWRARDSRKAIDLFRKAAEQGDLRSMKRLGEIYHLGDGGIAKNDQAAARWYQRAANTGDLSSMYALGQIDAGLLAYGDAITWWTKAAAGGHVAAMYDLGTLYENGQGVPKNPKAALDLYRKAAVGGEPRAKKRVALLGKQR